MENAARHIVPSSSKQAICAGPAATARTPRNALRAEDPGPVPYLFQRSETSFNLELTLDCSIRTEHSGAFCRIDLSYLEYILCSLSGPRCVPFSCFIHEFIYFELYIYEGCSINNDSAILSP